MILFFSTPLFILFHNSISQVWFYGILWGFIAYGLHFVWLFDLLFKKSTAAFFFSILLYIGVVLYAALTSGTWFWATAKGVELFCKKLKRIPYLVTTTAIFFITTSSYFIFLDRYMFWFFHSGYPFLNPLIPLMQHQWSRAMVWWVLSLLNAGAGVQPNVIPLDQKTGIIKSTNSCACVYLPPTTKKNMLMAALQIDDYIQAAKIKTLAEQYESVCILGPETTFPFPLNKQKRFVTMWTADLPPNVHLFLGALRCDEDRVYQTVYWLKQGLIMQYYDKELRVAFTEKLPYWCKQFSWIKSLFLQEYLPIKKGKNTNKNRLFSIEKNVCFEPMMCSELFFTHHKNTNVTLLVAFINDSWFMSYFKNLMFLLAKKHSLLWQKSVLYVKH